MFCLCCQILVRKYDDLVACENVIYIFSFKLLPIKVGQINATVSLLVNNKIELTCK